MEDWLKCQINSLVKYRQNQTEYFLYYQTNTLRNSSTNKEAVKWIQHPSSVWDLQNSWRKVLPVSLTTYLVRPTREIHEHQKINTRYIISLW